MAKLYLVPTPLGNLGDITFRAIEVLKSADLVLAEDTRKTGLLLKHYSIDAKLFPYHQHNEHHAVKMLVDRVASGQTLALCTDAGTPGISDPGFLIVRECVKEGIEVECLPGAVALIPALVNSGLPCDRFCFEGFLPQKKGRQTRIKNLLEETRTMVFYESPHRLLKALKEFSEAFGPDRKGSVSRELTKMYEETVRGTVSELIEHFSKGDVKGEIVIVIAGKDE
jgi:16S rRNA (cytidine1402-2'-O)-methyltransferase